MRFSLSIACLLLLSGTCLVAEEKSKAAEGLRLAVYLPDYRAKTSANPKLYGTTDLILFSAAPREDGTVDFSRITPALREVGREAQSQSPVSVTVCVGGWGRGKTFARAVSSGANRERFVKGLVAYCEEHDLAGVDIDWEFPKGEQEHADFEKFLASLSGKLHADGRILTIALGYTRPLSAECWAHIDRVHLMSYQPWTDQPYEPWLKESVERFLESGLPPEKLLVGLGFYTKEKAGERRAVSWKKITGEATGKLPESEHGYWPVGPDVCDLRMKFVKEYGLGGVMVWEYGHDSDDEEKSLLRHLSAKMGLSAESGNRGRTKLVP